MDKWNIPDYLLITLGAQGMALFEKNSNPVIIPTRAREVFDVSGAGDTVIATFTLALLSGASGLEAAEIANHAAGVVVGKVGTVSRFLRRTAFEFLIDLAFHQGNLQYCFTHLSTFLFLLIYSNCFNFIKLSVCL